MHVRPMTQQDAPYVADIFNVSFATDELFSWLAPGHDQHPGDQRRGYLIRMKIRLLEPGVLAFVAVTDVDDISWTGSEEVMGYAVWRRHGEDEGSRQWIHKKTWAQGQWVLRHVFILI
jgi:hypothetical protein